MVPFLAEQVSVKKAWDQTVRGELVEGAHGDYVLIRHRSGRETMLAWPSIYSIARAGYPPDPKERIELPWPARPTLGVHFGLTSLGAGLFSPYFGTGATVGVSGGVAVARYAALVVVYDWTGLGTDERNRGARGSQSHFIGVGGRLSTNRATGSAGLLFEPIVGLRSVSYSFSTHDGNNKFAASLLRERASLLGFEARFAIGVALTFSRAVSGDMYLAPGFGKFFHYEDSLDCATFKFGRCGGGYDFGYALLNFGVAVRWN